MVRGWRRHSPPPETLRGWRDGPRHPPETASAPTYFWRQGQLWGLESGGAQRALKFFHFWQVLSPKSLGAFNLELENKAWDQYNRS